MFYEIHFLLFSDVDGVWMLSLVVFLLFPQCMWRSRRLVGRRERANNRGNGGDDDDEGRISLRLRPKRYTMSDSWFSKTNETIIPGNPDRIKAKWDPLQYLNLTKPLKVFNEYPRDFNPRVHGPYCPWRYYGKRQ